MMHEEFERLAGVTVTGNYYRDVIEPQYVDAGNDKEVFVKDWLDANKRRFVKAVERDLRDTATKLAITECNQSEVEKAREEVKHIKREMEEKERHISALKKSVELYRASSEEGQITIADMSATQKKLEEAVEKHKEREAEVIRLKAKLYDMMEQQQATA